MDLSDLRFGLEKMLFNETNHLKIKVIKRGLKMIDKVSQQSIIFGEIIFFDLIEKNSQYFFLVRYRDPSFGKEKISELRIR